MNRNTVADVILPIIEDVRIDNATKARRLAALMRDHSVEVRRNPPEAADVIFLCGLCGRRLDAEAWHKPGCRHCGAKGEYGPAARSPGLAGCVSAWIIGGAVVGALAAWKAAELVAMLVG
jgi:hypothetical protein